MSIFKFKQFEVDQTGCAMKINTDGVLIAAMANHEGPQYILDIGTGTGVMALMLAQRFPEAEVEAVEIDLQAAQTAGRNFQLSVFNSRLKVHHLGIQEFHSIQKFDLIVSNPPFFVNDLRNDEERKGIARHADQSFFEMFIRKANDLLAQNGKFWVILPVKQADEVVKIAATYSLHLVEKVNLHSDLQKPTFRQIICLAKNQAVCVESDFYIYESLKMHSLSYKYLLKDFFLAF